MTRIVDGRSAIAEDQAGCREHQFAGSDDRECDTHPLPTPCSRRMDSSQYGRGDVWDRCGDTDPKYTVEPADVGPPLTACRAPSEMGVGGAGLDGRRLLVELSRQHDACLFAVHDTTGDLGDARSSRT